MSNIHDEAEERRRREREEKSKKGKIKGMRKKDKGKEKEKEEERGGEENIGRQKTDVQMSLSGICYLRHFSPALF